MNGVELGAVSRGAHDPTTGAFVPRGSEHVCGASGILCSDTFQPCCGRYSETTIQDRRELWESE